MEYGFGKNTPKISQTADKHRKIMKNMKYKSKLSSDDLRLINYALSEVLDFFRKDKRHQKKHENSTCQRCKDYKALQKKITDA